MPRGAGRRWSASPARPPNHLGWGPERCVPRRAGRAGCAGRKDSVWVVKTHGGAPPPPWGELRVGGRRCGPAPCRLVPGGSDRAAVGTRELREETELELECRASELKWEVNGPSSPGRWPTRLAFDFVLTEALLMGGRNAFSISADPRRCIQSRDPLQPPGESSSPSQSPICVPGPGVQGPSGQ